MSEHFDHDVSEQETAVGGGAFLCEPDVQKTPAADIHSITGLQELWNNTLGDPNITIAILDGPVDLAHPCFRNANISALPSIVAAEPDGGAASRHGTHVASVIFGQHGSSIQGIAPRCRGLSIPIFKDQDPSSFAPCSQIDLARAISQAIEAGANIINISGGQFSPSGAAHPILEEVVTRCEAQGVLIVAAAGNQGCECLHIPGAIPSVVAVGAMRVNGDPLEFSNWGYRTNGVLAPGEAIFGAGPDATTSTKSGTSFATPVVSGLSGLLMSLQTPQGVRPNAATVRAALLSTARDCSHRPIADCERLLVGRLDVAAAHRYILTGEKHVMLPSTLVQRSNGPASHPEASEISFDEVASIQPASCETMAKGPASELSSDSVAPSDVQTRISSSSALSDPRFQNDALVQQAATDVLPAGCGCGCGGLLPIVYALGKLSFDYGTRARRAFFASQFKNIDDPARLLEYLKSRSTAEYVILDGKQFANRANVTAITWILTIDDTPVYAIVPEGDFAFEIQDRLVGFLEDQVEEDTRIARINHQIRADNTKQKPKSRAEITGGEISLDVGRVSIPGVIKGKRTLFTGETVPVIRPDIRAMYSWTTNALAAATQSALVGTSEPSKEIIEATRDLADFLNIVYNDTRNLGVASRDRALNYAATDALVLHGMFVDIKRDRRFEGLEFDSFSVVKSPICRPDADCWDVVLFFYDPLNLQRARRAIRYTIDVSDTVPVILGRQQQFTTR